MRISSAVITTDQVNLRSMQMPLSTLLQAIERHVEDVSAAGIARGMPLILGHDAHLPAGWAVPLGVYVAKDMGRKIALLYLPEDDADRERISNDINRFRRFVSRKGAEPVAKALRERLAGFVTDASPFRVCEAAAICTPGLAATVFPRFFSSDSPIVDKDGLVDYAQLLAETRQLTPGIFHEPKRDLLLFAHPYFRRNLSRENSLNQYILERFDAAAKLGRIEARLRLDPDMVGHPQGAGPMIELEYWNGPRFDDDIEKIPTGVTVHKSTDSERSYSRIDETQIWWKDPERRRAVSGARSVRTFEIEELVDRPSAGLGKERYGCRYAHAEFDIGQGHISHFDGAIRAYEAAPYIERLDRRIDRAGKQADYQKLFRLDGELPVAMWKSLLTDYFRGNHLVPEYLGSPIEKRERPKKPSVGGAASETKELPDRATATEDDDPPDVDLDGDIDTETGPRAAPALAFFVGLDIPTVAPPAEREMRSDHSIENEGQRISIVEVGPGAVGALLTSWTDRSRFASAEYSLPIANLSPIHLPGDCAAPEDWLSTVDALALALRDDEAAGRVALVSVTIRWRHEAAEVSLSIAGKAGLVIALLGRARSIVDVGKNVSGWAEALRDALMDIAPDLAARVDWPDSTAHLGRILLPRPGNAMIGIDRYPVSANSEDPASLDEGK